MEESDRKEEGARLTAMREALGLSRSQLAARIGVSAVTVRNAENGNQRLGLRSWQKVEALAAGGASSAVADGPATYRAAPVPVGSSGHEAAIRQTLAAAADPAVQAAAHALADVTAMPYEDALALVVARKLRRG